MNVIVHTHEGELVENGWLGHGVELVLACGSGSLSPIPDA
jgi:hypothetical protein